MIELSLWQMILTTWHIIGGVIFGILSTEYYSSLDGRCILRPDWIYDQFNVNYFGCVILTILFNLLCPIISVIYWICKLIYFICTVGR
jgi:hypothetical protein